MSIESPEQFSEQFVTCIKLGERRLKRIAVLEKYKEELDKFVETESEGIMIRKYYHTYLYRTAYRVFLTEQEENETIWKVGRRDWSNYMALERAFKKMPEMSPVINEIMWEFGCYDL